MDVVSMGAERVGIRRVAVLQRTGIGSSGPYRGIVHGKGTRTKQGLGVHFSQYDT